VADADYDRRPPRVRPTALGTESSNSFFAASSIVHSSWDPSSPALAALPDNAVLAFNIPRIQAGWRPCIPIAPARGFHTSVQNAVQAGLV
jgi:hypothetical protein